MSGSTKLEEKCLESCIKDSSAFFVAAIGLTVVASVERLVSAGPDMAQRAAQV